MTVPSDPPLTPAGKVVAVVGTIFFVTLLLSPLYVSVYVEREVGLVSITDRWLGWLLAIPVGVAVEVPVVLLALLALRRSGIAVAIHACFFAIFVGHAIVEGVDTLLDASAPERCVVRIESIQRPKKGAGSLAVTQVSTGEAWTIDLSFARYDTRPGDLLVLRLHRGAVGLRWVTGDGRP